ncbi:uncharacterized protein LOC127858299 isoform X2 [Dreissena polymorpha]|uniref:uncharacterized protein LOC127858299 isoform X2 n=1 Tax=Dreissena polymorpha TaxID=45954 RepID=UPI0022654372|nr:uncharacterized protein LOC127858299 isoform X2 [Dreissena polymorpha]
MSRKRPWALTDFAYNSKGYERADTDLGTGPRDQSWKVRHERINMDVDHLSFVSNDKNWPGLYVAGKPLSPENYYFAIEIVHNGLNSEIGIGLVPHKYPLNVLPGWKEFSVGYHADDGYLYVGEGTGRSFGAKCNLGDRMGCGIQFTKSEGERRQMFFTRNGKRVGTVFVPNPPGGLYPAVGMKSDGEKVRLILDSADWQYDLKWILDPMVASMQTYGGIAFWVLEDVKRNQCKQIVLTALGLNTRKEVQDSYDQADNMLQYKGDVSTSNGRVQFLTRALELAKQGKTKWIVHTTVKRNGVEIPVGKQLKDKYTDQILTEVKRKF